jgi:hypothetical protein
VPIHSFRIDTVISESLGRRCAVNHEDMRPEHWPWVMSADVVRPSLFLLSRNFSPRSEQQPRYYLVGND